MLPNKRSTANTLEGVQTSPFHNATGTFKLLKIQTLQVTVKKTGP